MEKNRTVEKLVEEINALTPIEKLVIQQQLKEPAIKKYTAAEKEAFYNSLPSVSDEQVNEILKNINEPKYYTTTAQPQIHDPIAVASGFGKELPDRYEPSHKDLDEIFGGFQSHQSVEELVDEIYRMRTVGTEREPLNP